MSAPALDLLGNLACETEWAGGSPVPAHVARRIAAFATAMRALVDADAVTVWTPVPVAATRAPPLPGLPAAHVAVGTPPPGRPVLAWGASRALADALPPPRAAITRALPPFLGDALALPPPRVEIARRVNDRRFACSIAQHAGAAVPGASVITGADQIDRALAAAAAASPTQGWIAKAVLTAAGRDRARGGLAPDAAVRTRVERLLARHRALVVEPWLDRVLDVGVTGAIGADARVTLAPPHGLLTDAGGGFRGIDLAPPPLTDAEAARLADVVTGAGLALAAAGYRGVYTVDAFVHGDGAARALRPLVEINARLSFGVIARAACGRLGATRLVIGAHGDAPSAGARPLVAPSGDDPVGLWVH